MKAFLPEQTRVSQVHLRTASLERSLGFYADVLGLSAHHPNGSQAVLSAGAGPELLVLSEDASAPQRPPRSIGLYHLAIRYPERRDLAHAFQRLINNGYPVEGASDHGVSEAIYLSDPEGNGVELYADRPPTQWPRRRGHLAMVTQPLDVRDLLKSVQDTPAPPEPPAETDIGHIHLHVANLPAADRFYHEFLGLAVTQRSIPDALFLAAGEYHHHIGVNTWAGHAAPPSNSTGLISYRLDVPVKEILYCLSHRAPLLGYETRTLPDAHGPILQIRDPNGSWLEIQHKQQTSNPQHAEAAIDCEHH
ncbi:MAG TPA: VOC family protein [Verrucomicrobiae bacterium]|nr:VOC family protein [Verrucomicrobiae bacterium]